MEESKRNDRRGMGVASRERILEKAVELFARHGFAGTSVSVLCKEVGVAPTAIYWHFGSKSGLLAAALERAASHWIDQLTQSCETAERAEDQLVGLMAGLRILVTEHADELALIMTCFLQHAKDDPLVEESINRIQHRSVQALTAGLERAVQVNDVGLEAVAEMALGMIDYITLDYIRCPDAERLDQRLVHLQEMIVVGCCHALNKLEIAATAGTGVPTLVALQDHVDSQAHPSKTPN